MKPDQFAFILMFITIEVLNFCWRWLLSSQLLIL